LESTDLEVSFSIAKKFKLCFVVCWMRGVVVLGVIMIVIVAIVLGIFSSIGDDEEDKESLNRVLSVGEGSRTSGEGESFEGEDVSEDKVSNHLIEVLEEYTSESIFLAKSGRELNYNETLPEVVGTYLTDKNLPVFLKNSSGEKFNVERKISFSEDLLLEKFIDKDYNEEEYNDEDYETGFHLSARSEILYYILDFKDDVLWEEVVNTELFLFGRSYYISYIGEDIDRIELLKEAYRFDLGENETAFFEYTDGKSVNVSMEHFSGDLFRLNIGNESTDWVDDSGTYLLDGVYIYVEEVWEDNGTAYARMLISQEKVILYDGLMEYNGEIVKGIEPSIDSEGEVIEDVTLTWVLEGEEFLTSSQNLLVPFFDNMELWMSGLKRDASGTKYVEVHMEVNSYS